MSGKEIFLVLALGSQKVRGIVMKLLACAGFGILCLVLLADLKSREMDGWK